MPKRTGLKDDDAPDNNNDDDDDEDDDDEEANDPPPSHPAALTAAGLPENPGKSSLVMRKIPTLPCCVQVKRCSRTMSMRRMPSRDGPAVKLQRCRAIEEER